MRNIHIVVLISGLLALAACNQPAQNTPTTTTEPTTSVVPVGNNAIAYVNVDSLIANYTMTKDLSEELEKKVLSVDTELATKQKNFERKVKDFQNKAEKGLETRSKLAEIQQALALEEQQLAQLVQQRQLEMAEEQAVMQRKVLQAVMDYLKEYNVNHGYQFILANSFGSNILYANPQLDITADVLSGLNAAYQPAEATK